MARDDAGSAPSLADRPPSISSPGAIEPRAFASPSNKASDTEAPIRIGMAFGPERVRGQMAFQLPGWIGSWRPTEAGGVPRTSLFGEGERGTGLRPHALDGWCGAGGVPERLHPRPGWTAGYRSVRIGMNQASAGASLPSSSGPPIGIPWLSIRE